METIERRVDFGALADQIEGAKRDDNASKPGISESRLYDGRIEFALHGKDGRLYLSVELGGYVARNDCPHYTTSIDAALTLVPDGAVWRLMPSDYEGHWLSEVWFAADDDTSWYSRAASPALALSIAALKARET